MTLIVLIVLLLGHLLAPLTSNFVTAYQHLYTLCSSRAPHSLLLFIVLLLQYPTSCCTGSFATTPTATPRFPLDVETHSLPQRHHDILTIWAIGLPFTPSIRSPRSLQWANHSLASRWPHAVPWPARSTITNLDQSLDDIIDSGAGPGSDRHWGCPR